MATPRVGIFGLGAMGGGMARHLLKKGFDVRGFDVFPPSMVKFAEAGGETAATPKELVENSDVILFMVINAAQVSSILFGDDSKESAPAAPHLLPQSVILVSCTVPPEFCTEMRQRLDHTFHRTDIHLLDCPVSGGTPRAANGTLSIFVSGDEESAAQKPTLSLGLEKARSVLDALSAVLYIIPGGIGSGAKAKMCHQVLPEVEIALSNEAMALAALAGLNTQHVFDKVQSSEGSSWINGNRIVHMLDGDQRVYSAIPNSQKDSSIIVNTSRTVAFPVFLVATAEQVYQAGIHAGWAKDDDSTLWRLYTGNQPKNYIHQCTKRTTADARNSSLTTQDIVDIFAGGHVAAAAEAMGFTEAVGLNTDLMYDIISKAAGSNYQFVHRVPDMKKPAWSLRDVPQAKDVGQKMAMALTKANKIGASMPVAAAATATFQLAS